jgi:hypothetical protein
MHEEFAARFGLSDEEPVYSEAEEEEEEREFYPLEDRMALHVHRIETRLGRREQSELLVEMQKRATPAEEMADGLLIVLHRHSGHIGLGAGRTACTNIVHSLSKGLSSLPLSLRHLHLQSLSLCDSHPDRWCGTMSRLRALIEARRIHHHSPLPPLKRRRTDLPIQDYSKFVGVLIPSCASFCRSAEAFEALSQVLAPWDVPLFMLDASGAYVVPYSQVPLSGIALGIREALKERQRLAAIHECARIERKTISKMAKEVPLPKIERAMEEAFQDWEWIFDPQAFPLDVIWRMVAAGEINEVKDCEGRLFWDNLHAFRQYFNYKDPDYDDFRRKVSGKILLRPDAWIEYMLQWEKRKASRYCRCYRRCQRTEMWDKN